MHRSALPKSPAVFNGQAVRRSDSWYLTPSRPRRSLFRRKEIIFIGSKQPDLLFIVRCHFLFEERWEERGAVCVCDPERLKLEL